MEILQAVTWIRRALKDRSAVPAATLRQALQAVTEQIPTLIVEHRSLRSRHQKAIKDRAELHSRVRKLVRERGDPEPPDPEPAEN